MQNELYHHGIIGMRWGVRRFQNEDGSYTREGLARYNAAEQNYKARDARYKELKKTKASKGDITNARLARKNAKRDLSKMYDDVKMDRKADRGKERYSKGQTITGRNQVTRTLSSVGALSFIAAVGTAYYKVGNARIPGLLLDVSLGASAAAAASKAINNKGNNELRAYYNHSRHNMSQDVSRYYNSNKSKKK